MAHEDSPEPARRGSGRQRLGEILLAAGTLTREQLEVALAGQATSSHRERLGSTVVRLGLATESEIAVALAEQLKLAIVDLATAAWAPEALERVPRQLALRHQVLPLSLDEDTLTVATADPTNVFARDDLRVAAGVRVQFVVSTESAIAEGLQRAYGADQGALDAVRSEHADVVESHGDHDTDEFAAGDDQPIVKLVNLILSDAVRARASDVHVEPGRAAVRVRYRVDGLLREVMRVPREASAALTSRLKIMARLDISERRRPQDGRAVIRVDGEQVDVRVSTLPTMFGETTVLRLLRKGSEQLTLTEVGLDELHLAELRWALARPQGLVIITGPTGSGKTSTLYAGLGEIADPVRNIVTLEDPVEYQLEGVNQTQINDKIGLSFARGLRSILRQDPDIVLVGEIRDGETAQLALQASFTGHLVLSTLHTSDAPSSVVRLVDLCIEPFLIASSLLLVVAQRLARTVCPHCSEPTRADPRVLALLGLTARDVAGADLRHGRGCELCGRTGYRGRTGLFELLPVTPALRELLMAGATESAVARLARSEGMIGLREDGVAKALRGVITLEEVLRVTPAPSVAVGRCPNCDHPVDGTFLACPSCGSSLSQHACHECGRTLDPAWAMCPYCRTAVERVAGLVPDPAIVVGLPPSPTRPERTRPLVLVADDEGSVREVVSTMLSEEYDIIEALDGEEALRLAQDRQPDAIVIDIQMPELDGLEVMRRLRAERHTRTVPIIVVTGGDQRSAQIESLAAGADDILFKPFEPDDLVARLEAVRRRARAALGG